MKSASVPTISAESRTTPPHPELGRDLQGLPMKPLFELFRASVIFFFLAVPVTSHAFLFLHTASGVCEVTLYSNVDEAYLGDVFVPPNVLMELGDNVGAITVYGPGVGEGRNIDSDIHTLTMNSTGAFRIIYDSAFKDSSSYTEAFLQGFSFGCILAGAVLCLWLVKLLRRT